MRAGQCHPRASCVKCHLAGRRPDVEEAWFEAMNFMARQLDGLASYRLPGRDGDGEKKNGVAGGRSC
jgi:hypothetical protein